MLDSLREFTFLSVCLRLLLAMAAGGVVGFGRAKKKETAGLRTYIITCLGAALTTMISFYEFSMLSGAWEWASAGGSLKFDGSRFSAAVISGIGFLAAGSIMLVRHQQVSGLTTAIGLFVTACMGIAIGAGFYEGAVLTTVLVLVTEITLGRFAEKIKHDPEFRIEVDFQEKPVLDRVLRYCKDKKTAITNLQVITAVRQEGSCYCGFITLRPHSKLNRDELFASIRSFEGVSDMQEVELRED